MRAIPEHLRGVFTTRHYTNPRLPLPYLMVPVKLAASYFKANCPSKIQFHSDNFLKTEKHIESFETSLSKHKVYIKNKVYINEKQLTSFTDDTNTDDSQRQIT